MRSVFISGSIAIKKLPSSVEKKISTMKENNLQILVGDAKGIDTKVQEYCKKIQYDNVVVYSIYSIPRNIINNNFKTKHIRREINADTERERQTEKDKEMTLDSEFGLIVWDGSSKGSYANIIRAIENNKGKKIRVYLAKTNNFISQKNITSNKIKYIYRENNGYKACEIVDHLKINGSSYFKNTQTFNKWLINENIVRKEKKIYMPMDDYKHLLIADKYRGQIIGVKFKTEFIKWIENKIPDTKQPIQSSLL